MSWIKIVDEDKADGVLARVYEAARKRRGVVANIIKIQSVNPPVLRSSMALYADAVLAESPLSRAQRELIAVVVSAANDCHY